MIARFASTIKRGSATGSLATVYGVEDLVVHHVFVSCCKLLTQRGAFGVVLDRGSPRLTAKRELYISYYLEKHCFDPPSLSSTRTSDSASEKRLMICEINAFITRVIERKESE